VGYFVCNINLQTNKNTKAVPVIKPQDNEAALAEGIGYPPADREAT